MNIILTHHYNITIMTPYPFYITFVKCACVYNSATWRRYHVVSGICPKEHNKSFVNVCYSNSGCVSLARCQCYCKIKQQKTRQTLISASRAVPANIHVATGYMNRWRIGHQRKFRRLLK